jgi:hypothetical protein
MTELTNSLAATPPTPDDAGLVPRAERVLSRLRSSIWLLLEDLPSYANSVRGLSAWSGVSHAVCQRAIAGCRPGLDPLEVLVELPGPEGLAKLIEAVRERLPFSPHLAEATAAHKAYLGLLESFHGRRRGLVRALRRTPASARAESVRGHGLLLSRQQMFEASLSMSRCWAECTFCCRVVRVAPDGRVRQYVGAGWRRLSREAGHMGLILCWVPSDSSKPCAPPVADPGQGPLPPSGAILKRFSTYPVPTLVSREMTEFTIWLVDPESPIGAPLDLALAFPFVLDADPHEPFLAPMSPRVPSKHLVMDTYFHRETVQVRAMEPVLTLTHSAGGQNKHLAERWYDELPLEARPERLGPATTVESPLCFPAMRALARELMQRLGDEPRDYVGYRLAIDYPMWGQQHTVQFDLNYARPAHVPPPRPAGARRAR